MTGSRAVVVSLQPAQSPPARALRAPIVPDQGLADYPFEWTLKWIWGASLDQAAIVVHDAVVDNYFPWHCTGMFKRVFKCLSYDTVQLILATYANLVLNGTLRKEYTLPMDGHSEYIYKIAEAAGFGRSEESWKLVYWCMYELLQLTNNGTVASTRILKPKTAEKNADIQSSPFGSLDNTLDQVTTWAKWILTLAILGGAAWGGYQLYSLFKTTKD